jgi:integrase
MGRRRNRANSHLPKGVYKTKQGYVFRPYLGSSEGRPRFGKDMVLARHGAPISEVLDAYARMGKQDEALTLRWLLHQYLSSPHVRGLASKTRKDYEGYVSTLASYPVGDGVFGDVALSRITKRTIRTYLDTYKCGKAPVSANRQIEYLRAAWNWCEERFDVPRNPCIGVKPNREHARTRYVTQDELAAAKALTRAKYLPVLMELCYLLRARVSEVARLTDDNITERGIVWHRGKGSRGEVTVWTPRLRAAVQAAREIYPDAPLRPGQRYLLHTRHGEQLKKNAIDSAMGRLRAKLQAQGVEPFTLHDLKAAGYSDQQTQYAGHKSRAMHDVYDRKLREVEPPA